MSKGRPLPGVRAPGLTRRRFLGAAGALAFGPALAHGRDDGPVPMALPVSARRESFLNWSGEIRVPDAWTAAPRTPLEAAGLADWALDHGWRLRARGMGHGWSPLLASSGRPLPPALLVDLTAHLDQVRVEGSTLTAQAGASLDRLWEAAGAAGLAVASTPAPGNLTLGGALAIGAHGSVLPGPAVQGWTWGSLSNAVLALEAVVWDPGTGRHVVRTFGREDPEIGPLLVHMGRALVTSATLQLGADVNLRCLSTTDVPAAELYAPPALAGPRSFQALALASGRVEATWFPFTECPWVRVWSAEPERPAGSAALDGPYPYTFANWVGREESDAVAAWLREAPSRTPAFLGLERAVAQAGLDLTGTRDVWGPSRFSTLHVKPSTLRYHVSGHTILCRRADLQRVASEFHRAVEDLLEAARARGAFPVNGPVDLRATGLDHAAPGQAEALLSPIRPRPDHPEWDCAVWAEVLTLPGTPGAMRFFTDLETWMLGNYTGDYAGVRVEWAKGWAYSRAGPWTGPGMLEGHIPRGFTEGYGRGWREALEGLRALDPAGIFGSPFLDRLTKAR